MKFNNLSILQLKNVLQRNVLGKLQTRYNKILETNWRKIKTNKRKKKLNYKEAAELVPQIKDKYFKIANTLFDRRKKIEDLLYSKAELEEIKINDHYWLIYDSVSTSTYASQGFGAAKYSRESAEMIGLKLDYYRVPFRIVFEKGFRDSWGIEHGTFHIYAAVDEFMAFVLKYKAGPTLKEIVKNCWKRGVQPRVYFPTLPYEYEQKMGLDYFGNEIIKE